MRDGSTRRPSTSSRSRTWTSDRVQVQHWRERHRHAVLRELADGSQGVAWTRRLLNVLLEELHVTDEFDRLVGPTSRLPASQYSTAGRYRAPAATQLVAPRPRSHRFANRALGR